MLVEESCVCVLRLLWIIILIESSATIWSNKLLVWVHAGDASETFSEDTYLFTSGLLLENICDQFYHFVRIKVSQTLLVEALRNQIVIEDIAETALYVLGLIVDKSDKPIPDFTVIPRIDLTG